MSLNIFLFFFLIPAVISFHRLDMATPTAASFKEHMVANVRMTEKSLNAVVKSIRAALKKRLTRFSLPLQTIYYLGFTVNATNIKMSNFTTPEISMSLRPPSYIDVSVRGGNFHACADWEAGNWILPGPRSTACVTPREPLNMEINVFGKVAERGSLFELVLSNCMLNSPLNVGIPRMIGTALTGLELVLERFVQSQFGVIVCQIIDENIKALFGVDGQINVNKYYAVKQRFRKFIVYNNELRAELVAMYVPRIY